MMGLLGRSKAWILGRHSLGLGDWVREKDALGEVSVEGARSWASTSRLDGSGSNEETLIEAFAYLHTSIRRAAV